MATDPKRGGEKRWSWWGQARDSAATIAGFSVLAVETFRGTYNPLAMTFVAACIGVVSTGVLTRILEGRGGGGGRE